MEHVFPNSLMNSKKTLGNGVSQSFMLSLKCDHPLVCEFSFLFSTVKINVAY